MITNLKHYVCLAVVIVSAPAVLVGFFLGHWGGYLCGCVYGIVVGIWREAADQFRLGRYHMTGDGETHP